MHVQFLVFIACYGCIQILVQYIQFAKKTNQRTEINEIKIFDIVVKYVKNVNYAHNRPDCLDWIIDDSIIISPHNIYIVAF